MAITASWPRRGNRRVATKRHRHGIIPRSRMQIPTLWITAPTKWPFSPFNGPITLKTSTGERIPDVMGFLNDQLLAHTAPVLQTWCGHLAATSSNQPPSLSRVPIRSNSESAPFGEPQHVTRDRSTTPDGFFVRLGHVFLLKLPERTIARHRHGSCTLTNSSLRPVIVNL
jgi:hypothetical protein